MKEEIVSFAPNSDLPFYVTMCGISYCDGSYRIVRRKSDVSVVEYIISGTGTVIERGRLFYPCEGDVYLLKQGEEHLYYSDADNPWTKIWMNFSGVLADRIIESYRLKERVCFHAPELKTLFFEIYSAAGSGMGAKAVCDKAAVIFLKLAQRLAEHCALDNSRNTGIAAETRAYIDDMTDFSVKLDDISARLSYSKNHIIRTFKNEYGITPYEYMLNRRFEVAASLLKNTAYSVAEISDRLGFCDAKYFSGCFAKRYNAAPSVYRKENA